jgi:disulfide bond formation protein DsbB
LAQRCNIIAVPLLVIFTLPVLLAAMVALRPAPPKSPWVDEAALLGVQPVDLFWGEVVFRNTCTVCHGQDANGIPMLGKPLRNSAFVQATSDDELAAYIAEGRPVTAPENTTGVPMPPRGGNATLTDERIRDAVYYLRTLQDPSAPTASLEAWIRPAQPVITQVADGAHPGAVPPSFDPAGHDAFISGCSSCHGPDAMGLPNLGKPLKTSKFIAEHTDDEMLAFVKKGRPIWDSLNTTGVDMPPKGGNPALSDDQIRLIITYLRAIHSDAEPGEAQSEIAAK